MLLPQEIYAPAVIKYCFDFTGLHWSAESDQSMFKWNWKGSMPEFSPNYYNSFQPGYAFSRVRKLLLTPFFNINTLQKYYKPLGDPCVRALSSFHSLIKQSPVFHRTKKKHIDSAPPLYTSTAPMQSSNSSPYLKRPFVSNSLFHGHEE